MNTEQLGKLKAWLARRPIEDLPTIINLAKNELKSRAPWNQPRTTKAYTKKKQ